MAKEFKNNFSWSFSRLKLFDECLRQYYLNYYGSWGGWKPEGEPLARLAYRLKQMTNMAMWAGDISHRAIEETFLRLRRVRPVDAESIQVWARKALNDEWFQSVEKRWKKNCKYNMNLFEHYYDVEISAQDRDALKEKVYTCIDNFFNCENFIEARELGRTRWRSIEELETYMVGDVLNYVKIDLAYDRENGEVVLVDWKTGRKNPDDRRQMASYALYACKEWGLAPEKVRLAIVYLALGETDEWTVEAHEMMAMRETIFQSASGMRELLDDPIENEASIENFPKTENRNACRRCRFQEICFEQNELPVHAANKKENC